MSVAETMTPRQQAAFLGTYTRMSRAGTARDCEYGHIECSTKEGGACMNEVLGLIEAREGVKR